MTLPAAHLAPLVAVTGTDTGVGKTYVTAAIARLLADRFGSCHIRKLVQAGLNDDGESDAATAYRLTTDGVHRSGCTWGDHVVLDPPMAPLAAAQLSGATLPSADHHVRRLGELPFAEPVVVEGSGGALVPLTATGDTLVDIVQQVGRPVTVVIAASPTLGTINHTLLTVEALQRRGADRIGIIFGSWPADATMLEQERFIRDSNVEYLRNQGIDIWGHIPQGATGAGLTDSLHLPAALA